MVTMIDEIFDRQFQAGRADFNAAIVSGVSRIGKAFGNAFGVLNRIEYSAPWAASRKRLRTR
jgi:hypothetical protein